MKNVRKQVRKRRKTSKRPLDPKLIPFLDALAEMLAVRVLKDLSETDIKSMPKRTSRRRSTARR